VQFDFDVLGGEHGKQADPEKALSAIVGENRTSVQGSAGLAAELEIDGENEIIEPAAGGKCFGLRGDPGLANGQAKKESGSFEQLPAQSLIQG
jgi:hypothetical protein